MHFTIEKQVFLGGIQRVQRAIASSTNIPALTGIYIKADEQTLQLRATDLDNSIACTLPAQIFTKGEVVLPARYLGEIVRKLPLGLVELQVPSPGFTAQLTGGRASFQLFGFQPTDFPQAPEVTAEWSCNLNQGLLRKMINQTAFAAAQDNLRPVFTGILFSLDKNKLEMVATDSHRLAFAKSSLTQNLPAGVKAVVPRKALEELARILDEDDETLAITCGSGQIIFSFAHTTIASRLLEGQFMDYRQVLPQHYKTRIHLDREGFLSCLERAAILTQDKANSVRLEVAKDSLQIFANTPEVGKVEEKIPAVIIGDADICISFNSRYLIEVLRVLAEPEIYFDLTGSVSPGIIRPVERENYLHLIMPVTTRAAT